jgi:hypothetical protein
MSKKSNVLDMTPEEAQAFLRRVMGPPRRVLEGTEREQVLLMLAFTTPDSFSNNQHSWSEDYVQGGRHWCVTTISNEVVIVEEIEHETDQ